MDSDNTPTSLYVYKGEGGFFTNDKIVKDVDKANVHYYLSHIPQTRGWRSILYAQRKNGPTLCVMSRNMNGDINVDYMTEQWETQLHQKSHVPGQNHRYFEGPDRKEYHWRGAGTFSLSNDIQCFDSDNNLIAKYTGRALSLNKDGELVVQPPGLFMLPLLVATSLVQRIPGTAAIPSDRHSFGVMA